jgi:hypothetical protein
MLCITDYRRSISAAACGHLRTVGIWHSFSAAALVLPISIEIISCNRPLVGMFSKRMNTGRMLILHLPKLTALNANEHTHNSNNASTLHSLQNATRIRVYVRVHVHTYIHTVPQKLFAFDFFHRRNDKGSYGRNFVPHISG